MLRAIILVLVLFVSMGTIIPLATDHAEAGAKKTEWRKKKKKKRYKRYKQLVTSRYSKTENRSRNYSKAKKHKSPKRYRKTKRTAKRYRTTKSSKRYRKAKTTRRYRKTNTRKSYRKAKTTKRYRSSKRYRKARSSKKRYKGSKRYRSSKKRYKNTAKTRRVRKYSKTWLRNYRAKKAGQKAIAKRKRNLRLKRIRLAKAKRKTVTRNSTPRNVAAKNRISISGNAVLPVWMKEKLNEQVRANAPSNAPQTNSDLIVVTDAVSPTSGRKNVAGVAISDLRKTVIDKMIEEKGWVVNDLEKYVDGKKVYVVVAKSPDANGVVKSRIFYFAESKGRIYSRATVSPDDSNVQIANESEKLVKTLEGTPKPVQSAKKIDN